MSTFSFSIMQPVNENRELNKLVVAAVISESFRDLLLTKPELALQQGYNGEQFYLTTEEQALVLSIQASSLSDFAQKLSAEQSNKLFPYHPDTNTLTGFQMDTDIDEHTDTGQQHNNKSVM